MYRWNLLFLGGAAAAAVISGHPDVALPLVAAGEIAYLAPIGAPTVALITDMDQSLAPAVGNSLETRLAIDYLRGELEAYRLDKIDFVLGEIFPSSYTDEYEAIQRMASALSANSLFVHWVPIASISVM